MGKIGRRRKTESCTEGLSSAQEERVTYRWLLKTESCAEGLSSTQEEHVTYRWLMKSSVLTR